MVTTLPKKKPRLISNNSNIIAVKPSLPISLPLPAASSPQAHTLDHILHAAVAKFTGNLSPASLSLARHDWFVHLASSPEKILSLQKSLADKITQLAWYSMQALTGKELEPLIPSSPGDRRFKGNGWQQWPFNFLYQGFLLSEDWWKEATTDGRGASAHHLDVVSFTARQWLDAFSPSNGLLTNPDVVTTTINEGGANLWQGYLNWVDDQMRNAAGKSPAGTEAFKVGENVAITKGKVIFCNQLIELIQYEPTTSEVYAEPILIVPAWIMKYYILDLSPENSMVKYLVDKGHTVFMISWKNPDASDRNIGMEDYIHMGLEEALNVVKAITGERVHAVGYCIGGTLLSIMASVLSRNGDNTLKSMTLFATQTDFQEAGELLLFTDESQLAFLEDVMWQQGYLDKTQMAGAFELLSSNDLIWSHLANDYLQGKRRDMNDLMAWDADATRMPYRMHGEYLRHLFLKNDLAEGRYEVNGEPVALQDINIPIFCVGTVRDQVAPWKSVYKIHLLTDSEVTFVLTSGGHNAGIVSEPGHKGRTYQIATTLHEARYIPPGQWQHQTPVHEGSWWEAWQQWLIGQCEGKRKPPTIMGNKAKGYAPIGDAPGTYVFVT
jgi:polyhydroxyalkanoate synthase